VQNLKSFRFYLAAQFQSLNKCLRMLLEQKVLGSIDGNLVPPRAPLRVRLGR
jgi:hypothetical protein